MTNNRDLLKEAIADAKSVKETAIENAKLALEEAFTPYLKNQLSAKLQEMDDEEEVQEVKKSDKEEVKEVEAKEDEKIDEEINLDELLAEIELDENARTDAEEEGYKDGLKDEKEDLEEDARTDAEEEGYKDGEEDEKEDIDDEDVDLEDLSEDDLKSFIEDVIKDMVASGEIEPGDEFEEVEVEDEDVEVEVEDEDVDVAIELDEDMSDPDQRKKYKDESKPEEETEADRFKEGMDVDVDLDEDARVNAAAGGLENIVNSLTKLAKAAGPAAAKAKAMLQGLAQAAHSVRNEGEDYAEMEELKQELQEVNLLNAKLLYTNKIFKAKNLTESKKVKVLKAFDNAKDVKHAKTIFETLETGLMDKSINESRFKGSASKASGLEPKATSTKQPIIESNDVYNRMRKLAGLI